MNSVINIEISSFGVSNAYEDLNTPNKLISPATKKRNSAGLFLTQRKESNIENTQVFQKHQQLNNYIDILDEKIQKKVQHNEAEMLFAYKNHLIRVRRQMQEIRQQALSNANSSSSQLQKIDSLEKQLIIFREESLKLFQKILQKDKIIEDLKIHLDQYKAEKKFMDQSMKALIKKNKELESLSHHNTSNDPHNVTLSKIQVNQVPYHYKPYYRASRINNTRPYTTATNPKMIPSIDINTIEGYKPNQSTDCQQIQSKIKAAMEKCDESITKQVLKIVSYYSMNTQKQMRKTVYHEKESVQYKNTRFSMRSRSNYTGDVRQQKNIAQSYFKINEKKDDLKIKSTQYFKNQEMLTFFGVCVENVKKEIARRKGIKSANFYKEGSPITLEEFKKLDFFRLLELVFANQKIITKVYDLIFTKRSE